MTTKKERAEALARMTKAELVKTVTTLDARQVKLLNRIATLERAASPRMTLGDAGECTTGRVSFDVPPLTVSRRSVAADVAAVAGSAKHPRPSAMPWETALAETTDYAPSSGEPIKRGE